MEEVELEGEVVSLYAVPWWVVLLVVALLVAAAVAYRRGRD